MKVTNLIIGAGISGLTYANYAKEDYLIVEKESEVGGYCRTIKSKDYVWDYAGHFFHFKTDEFKKKFLDKMDKDDIVKVGGREDLKTNQGFYIYRNKRFV